MLLRNVFFALFFVLLGCEKPGIADDNSTQDNDKETDETTNSAFQTKVPYRDYDLMLFRITGSSVLISISAYKRGSGYIEYYKSGNIGSSIITFELIQDDVTEILVSNLLTSTTYDYYVYFKSETDQTYRKSTRYSFRTSPEKTKQFNIAITADSHLDQMTDIEVYKTTLLNILYENPDFLIELGDTFMNDKYGTEYKNAILNYLAQRYYFGQVCHSIPFFFVQGNHDGEFGQYNNNTNDNIAIWSNITRKKYFSNPVPDSFYSGNSTPDPYAGFIQNYYSWTWGNALFIVLDPFWYSPPSGSKEPWHRTLGKEQYEWLKGILEKSTVKYKFVFIHNLTGGLDLSGKARGGGEAAKYYEWGGKSLDGTDEFEIRRSGWEMPIHQLLVKFKVNIVFHGHDHFFAHQNLDGVIYQCLPQPGAFENSNANQASEYGYVNGVFLGGAGFLNLRFEQNETYVDYVSTSVKSNSNNKKVIYSYKL